MNDANKAVERIGDNAVRSRRTLCVKIMKQIFGTLLLILIFFGCSREIISVQDTALYLPSIEKGNQIIASLETYFKKNGRYPKNLNKLVPDYLSKIPEAGNFGNTFYYSDFRSSAERLGKEFNGPEGFRLTFSLEKPSFLDLGARARSVFVYRTNEQYGSEKEEVHFKSGKWAYVTQFRHKVGEGGRVK